MKATSGNTIQVIIVKLLIESFSHISSNSWVNLEIYHNQKIRHIMWTYSLSKYSLLNHLINEKDLLKKYTRFMIHKLNIFSLIKGNDVSTNKEQL